MPTGPDTDTDTDTDTSTGAGDGTRAKADTELDLRTAGDTVHDTGTVDAPSVKRPWWKPTPHLAARLLMVGLAIAIPFAVVGFGSAAVNNAAYAALKDQVTAQTAAGKALAEAQAQITYSDALDTLLLAYLALAGVVAGIGSVMRAFVHSLKVDNAEALDFAGKCLAVSAATIAAVGAIARFAAGPGQYVSGGAVLVAIGGVAVAIVGFYLGGRWVAKLTPRKK